MRKPSSTRPPPSPVFFTDRDLGHKIADALLERGVPVERHDDHFGPLTPDTTWLRAAGDHGWIVLSHNSEIRYVTEERDMVMRAGVPLFILIGHTTHDLLARNVVQTLGQIHEFLASHEPPFIARVYRPSPVEGVLEGKPGRVEMWLSHAEWLASQRE